MSFTNKSKCIAKARKKAEKYKNHTLSTKNKTRIKNKIVIVIKCKNMIVITNKHSKINRTKREIVLLLIIKKYGEGTRQQSNICWRLLLF